jgi:hypothetical protein
MESKFSLLGVSSKKGKEKRATIKFEPSHDLKNYIEDNIKVVTGSLVE